MDMVQEGLVADVKKELFQPGFLENNLWPGSQQKNQEKAKGPLVVKFERLVSLSLVLSQPRAMMSTGSTVEQSISFFRKMSGFEFDIH